MKQIKRITLRLCLEKAKDKKLREQIEMCHKGQLS